MDKLKSEIKRELTERIIPFWNSLADYERGGFFGRVSYDLEVDKSYDKGVILHSRILWFYSNCYLVLKDASCLEQAKRAYDFLAENCVDSEYGGVYWSVSYKGEPVNQMKHGYCQAFFIYALSSYYAASRDEEALSLALSMFETVEEKLRDDVSYREACGRDWQSRENDELSENGIKADKTMNTVLHLIEAYTELYKVSRNVKVAERLEFLLALTYNKIYAQNKSRLNVFFDNDMNVRGNIHSYGHDIEAAWLLQRAIEVGEAVISSEIIDKVKAMCKALTEEIYAVAFSENVKGMNYESDDGKVNLKKVWWAQAEALTGFVNMRRLYKDERYLERAKSLWEFIEEFVLDKRKGGEWFNELDEDNVPYNMAIVDEWKCPYHNGRMCLEVING